VGGGGLPENPGGPIVAIKTATCRDLHTVFSRSSDHYGRQVQAAHVSP